MNGTSWRNTGYGESGNSLTVTPMNKKVRKGG